jgi:alpha-tubulin suppressor-like RCC1 family protein
VAADRQTLRLASEREWGEYLMNGQDLVDISGAGHGYSCVLDTAGKPYCWGENEHSQLGDGTTTNSNVPVAVVPGVLAGKHLRRIVDQFDHTCVLDATGAAYCWGHENLGGLGNNHDADVNVTVPTAVIQPRAFTDLSPGEHLTCAVGVDQQAYCWGDNHQGGVGDNTTTNRSIPVAVDTSGVLSGKHVVTVSTADDRACVLDSTGAAYCWGENTDGELGNGSTVASLTPVAVDKSGVLAGKRLVRIETDNHHTCALDDAGAAYCWGLNSEGQLGDGSTTSSTTAVAVDMSALPGGTTFTDIRLGYRHTCAQTVNGRVYCWGSNSYGQLGDGTTVNRSKPAESVHNLPVLPSRPTGLAVTRDGASGDVTWTAPVDLGSPNLAEYVVTISPGGRTCRSATTRCHFDGLSTATAYRFTVTAVSTSGASAGGSVASAASAVLPVTGRQIVTITLLGLTLVGLGVLAVLAARRRAATGRHSAFPR